MKRFVMVVILAVSCGACSGSKTQEPASTLTEAQRDSVLGQSNVPGAGAIGRAQGAGGIEADHSAGVNAMVDSLPR